MNLHLPVLFLAIATGSTTAFAGERKISNIAELRASLRSSKDDTVIHLASGRYELSDTLDISRASNLQLLGPASGPPAVLSGSILLPEANWRRPSDPNILARVIDKAARPRLVEYQLNRTQSRQLGKLTRRGFEADKFAETAPATLVFNQRTMTLARWPNDKPHPIGEVLVAGPKRSDGDAYYTRGGAFRIDSRRSRYWQAANEIWIDGILGRDWQWSFNRVAKLYPDRGIVELRHGEVEGILDDDWLHTGVRFVNLLEEIDEPSEYHIDRRAGKIYFLPPPSTTARITTELTWMNDPLVRISKSSGVTLRNIILDGGRSHGVDIRDSSSVFFDQCEVRNCSGDGIRARGQKIRIARTIIRDIGAAGIRLEGGDMKALIASGSSIENCTITRNARFDRIFNAALSLEGVGHTVRGCTFDDLPHMAIDVTGNDMLIEGNVFTRTSRSFRDMGAIYANIGITPEMRGHVIRGNLFHDIAPGGRSTGAIYLDNGSCGFTIEKNAFLRVGGHEDSWAVMIHGGGENIVRENLFIDCARPLHVAYWWNGYGKGDFENNFHTWKRDLPRLSRHQSHYPELANFFKTDRRLPLTNSFTANLIVNRNQPLAHDSIVTTFSGPPDLLNQSGNTFFSTDPGFADLEGGTLTLGPYAPVLELLPHLRKLVLPQPESGGSL